MILAKVSIKRPVFTTVIIAAIVVFGAFLYTRLAVDMLPDVDPPLVTVTTVYPGASPETMEGQVAEPIEDALGTLGGVSALRSVCIESVAQTIIELDLDTDLDVAIQDVRDRIAAVSGELPSDAEAPRVEKLDLGAAPIIQLAVTTDGRASETELARFVDDVVKPGLEQLSGVGQVEAIGSRDEEVHLWIDPAALRSRGLTVLDLAQALGAQNVDIPAGRIDRGESELILRTDARATDAAELEQLAIATIPGSGSITVGDVATVEQGFEESRSQAFLNGQPAIAVVVRKQSGENTVAVAERVNEALPAIQGQAPAGVTVTTLLDNSLFIRSSVESVQLDLVLGGLLAVCIIFLFLRDPRATIISALALPTSVIGTFAFVQIMGFTINMMTTLALSLSIGILIDDAIVVIENIVRRRTVLKESPQDAAYRGTAEIGLAVLATTLSIVAVFVPVATTDGMVGKFFFQFGLTVAFAVLLSLFVSFTLTPMLSARFLREHTTERGLSALIGRALDWLDRRYRWAISWVLRHRIVAVAGAVACLGVTVWLFPSVGFEMVPAQDRGEFYVRLEMPTGATVRESTAETRAVAEQIRQIPGVESTFSTVGGGALGRVNTSEIVVSLVPRDQRDFKEQEVIPHVRELLGQRRGIIANVEPMNIAGVNMGRSSAVQVVVAGEDLDEIRAAAQSLAERLRATPGFVDVDTTARPATDELRVELDRPRAADLGVLSAPVAMTVRAMVAGQVVSQLDAGAERHDIRIQLPAELRRSVTTLEDAQVRTPAGQLVDLGAVATIVEAEAPNEINRYNRQRQVMVYANLEDLALGEALSQVEQIADEDLPPTVSYTFEGMSKSLGETMTNLGIALLLSIICIYLVLAAQFESFIHPLTIMISLPFSAIGALAGLLITGSSMSIFAMIGFIMLMGLVTKNAILLVDLANQLRDRGKPLREALIEAGATRLRPILMTTAAMVFGMLPAAIGHGDGGELRSGMGIAVIGGLITSTALTLLVVPVFYTYMDALGQRITKTLARLRRQPVGQSPAQGLAVTVPTKNI